MTAQAKNTEELLPCPFCGAQAQRSNGFSPLESIDYAWCTNDDCFMEGQLIDIERWNKRAVYPILLAQRERLVSALKPFAALNISHIDRHADDTIIFDLNGAKITLGDVREARSALRESAAGEE